ncbi:hypothetical protein [Ammoniphilus sp. CFH 90114]|uniref:hypothetical protein n=1 Tax=Ammoniphilus sp. CFH 90114 TaxID=2493665 RepID=UPI00100E290F|nr:hypothetical protein [Ammoniphilus sp. CFH 90114]RXT05843.1 hypothetical protein EIZ39_17225 [Ammoniphilus sp. CFH 90114]
MAKIELYPELRTTGGEALSIHRKGEWIGDVYLIYRENDLLTGTIHLDEEYVEQSEVYRIIQEVQSYITSLSYALNVTDHNINILFGQYSLLEDYTDEMNEEEVEEDDFLGEEVTGYERWIVGQGKNGIEYQVYDDEGDLVAEAVVDIKGTRIVGDIHFTSEPTEQVMEDIEAVLLKDYDHDLIDQYNFTFFVNGQEYEEVEIETEDIEENMDLETESSDSIIQMLEREEEEDDYEDRERAEVVFDLVDEKDRPLGEATFYYSEDGVDVTVELAIKPTEDTAHHLMKSVFEEALTDPMEWVNIRMYHQGQVVDGFHFERGKESSSIQA